MPRQKPVIRHQDELDWEGWTDPDLAAKSPCRWRLLVTGERDSSSGLVSGIAELPPGVSLPLHHHEPEETYYVVSGCGHVAIDDSEASLGSGSAVYIPSNAKHTIRCTGTEPLVFVFCLACDRFDQNMYHFDA